MAWGLLQMAPCSTTCLSAISFAGARWCPPRTVAPLAHSGALQQRNQHTPLERALAWHRWLALVAEAQSRRTERHPQHPTREPPHVLLRERVCHLPGTRRAPVPAFSLSFFCLLLVHCSWPLRGYVGGRAVPSATILRVFVLVPGHQGGMGGWWWWGGSVGTPTYTTQNDPHDALISLNIHKWVNFF